MAIDYRTESDHYPIVFSLSLPICSQFLTTPCINQDIMPVVSLAKYRWQSNKIDKVVNYWNSNTADVLINSIYDALAQGNIDNACSILTNLISDAMSCMKVRSSGRSKPRTNSQINHDWWDDECSEKKQKVKEKHKLYKRSRTPDTRANFKAIRNEYMYLIKTKKREYDLDMQNSLFQAARDANSKQFWSMLRPTHSELSDTISPKQWYDYFASLFNSTENRDEEYETFYMNINNFVDDNFASGLEDDTSYNLGMLNDRITCEEITSAISRLKQGKSAGVDGIPSEFFITLSKQINAILVKLFNVILDSGHFPVGWIKGMIVPLHKKGSLDSPSNYRGITLLPIIGKIFSNVMFVRLSTFVDTCYPIVEEQHGFKKNHSTIDNIFTLDSVIFKYVFKHKVRLYCAFIDFEKAFDRVDHPSLFYKLFKIGMQGKMMKILHSIYNSVKSCVKTPQGITEFFECAYGVQQGSVLSPLLFNLFINDIGDTLRSGSFSGVYIGELKLLYSLFADDLSLPCNSKVNLQRQLDKLANYCKKWKLKVNINKSKVVVFRKGGRLKNYEKWTFNNHTLGTVSYFNYLGVTFSCTGNWTKAQEVLAQRGNKAMYNLLRTLRKYKHININLAVKIFDAKIQPILMYGSEIWGFHDGEAIEKVQISFFKSILKVGSNTCNAAVLGEIGRQSMRTMRQLRIIKYWLKLLNADESSHIKQCYRYQLVMANKGYNCWAYKVKQLLTYHNVKSAWDEQAVGNVSIFLSQFRKSCFKRGSDQWRISLTCFSKLDTYTCFKKHLNCESYLLSIEIDIYRIALCKLRVSDHLLRIESGRHDNIPREQRLCQLCNLHEVENEFHFLLICPALSELRLSYIPAYYCNFPSMSKFVSLLNSNELSVIINLSKFVYFGFKKHKTLTANL